MTTWGAKDKAALEATEMTPASLGAAANLQQFASEDYTGPSYDIFVSGWKWVWRKLGYSR